MPVDSLKPHLSRIYDYMLGGHHNYEVDRRAAAEILKTVPTYPKWARLNRWFLQQIASRWEQEGRTHILDLGSGLPTEGHINEVLPSARILFSDIDPIAVSYGEEIIKDQPNMKYILADAGKPAPILAAADQFFAGQRQVAIGCIGVAYLIPDDELHGLAQALHAWAAPGSVLAVSSVTWNDGAAVQASNPQSDAIKRHAGMGPIMRTMAQLAELLAPWRMREARSLVDWLNTPDMFTAEERSGMNAGLSGHLLEH
jgi:hypothetical protein